MLPSFNLTVNPLSEKRAILRGHLRLHKAESTLQFCFVDIQLKLNLKINLIVKNRVVLFIQIECFSWPGSSMPDLGQSVREWVTECHFWILTQRVTFKTWGPYDIWSEWYLTKRLKYKKTKKMEKQKGKKTKNQKKVFYCDVRGRAVLHPCDVFYISYKWK